jgi:DNA-binding MarR family transcriptional regulator
MNQKKKGPLAEALAHQLIRFKRFGLHRDTAVGVRQSELMMLTALVHTDAFRRNGAKTTELSSVFRITPAGVTHIIASLAAKNYVDRLDDAQDRRIVRIKATADGKRLVDKVVTRLVKKCGELSEHLGEADTKELIRLLGTTFEFLDEGSE